MMSGMMRPQPPLEEAAVSAVATEVAQRGWHVTPVSTNMAGIDLYAFWPYTNKRLAFRVMGNPRFDRRGQPEWLIGVWRFQSRPRTERGLPFFRHPYYPGFWVLWDFATQSDLTAFVWPQEDEGARARFFIFPTGELKQWLSETQAWAENYHGVRDRPYWLGMDVIGPFEERWDLLENLEP